MENDAKCVAGVVLMVNGRPCQAPLTTLNNAQLGALKRVITDELGQANTCCARRAKLYDFIENINGILSRRATVALCGN